MKPFFTTLLFAFASLFSACGENEAMAQSNMQPYTMKISINGKTMTATMAANSSAEALKALLEEGDLTFSVSDYGGFEKVGSIGHSLPQNNEQISTVPGDIILYMGNSVCFYYGKNAWNFTRLGKINFTSEAELRDFLNAGGGSVSVTLSLNRPTAVRRVATDKAAPSAIYSLDGQRVDPQHAKNGVFIVDGKKVKL